MLPVLDQALRGVPMIATLGIRAQEASPGIVVLRMPFAPSITNAAGAVHTAALTAVGEVAAAVVVATHPSLGRRVHLHKSTRIKYRLAARGDVTAHAALSALLVARVEQGAETIDIPVTLLDSEGRAVAELVSRFAFRRG
jgi:acyl-coenzyme A thioesterase PaaI-like protein